MPQLLVTGASGYLGGVLAARARASGWAIAGTVRTRPQAAPAGIEAHLLDIRDRDAVDALVQAVRPDAVVHTAYLQHGPEAAAVNVDGAAHVAAAAHAAGARLIHLSSDAIFRGAEDRALREEELADPVTAYGATKAEAEGAVLAAHPGALLARTSLLYGGPGWPPSPHEQLAVAVARGERQLTFFTDEIRCPIQVDDLAAALLELAGRSEAGPLNVAGADAVSRLVFARLVALARGESAARLDGGPAPPDRPRCCALDVTRAQALLETRLRGVHEVLGAEPDLLHVHLRR